MDWDFYKSLIFIIILQNNSNKYFNADVGPSKVFNKFKNISKIYSINYMFLVVFACDDKVSIDHKI
jgi:hypothetical protein